MDDRFQDTMETGELPPIRAAHRRDPRLIPALAAFGVIGIVFLVMAFLAVNSLINVNNTPPVAKVSVPPTSSIKTAVPTATNTPQ